MRKILAPPIKPIQSLEMPPVEHIKLNNGIDLYTINCGDHELTFLEIVFLSGRPEENKPLVSRSTASLLKEGTTNHSSKELAEKFDYYGSSLRVSSGMDYTRLSLFCLNKHIEEVLPILAEVVFDPVFPEHEVERFKQRSIQTLKVHLSQSEVVAHRKFTEILYGSDHPYGYNSTEQLYERIDRSDLKNHHSDTLTTDNCHIFASGKIEERIRRLIERQFGSVRTTFQRKRQVLPKAIALKGMHRETLNPSFQTSIRIGQLLFERKHEDYPGFFLLNSVFGGYFGSRLSLKIREESGLVYGVHSSMDMLRNSGSFCVSTETSHQNVDQVKTLIYDEMHSLRETLIGPDELEKARNYLLGQVLRMADGPYSVGQMVKTSVLETGKPHTIVDLVEKIKAITVQELRSLANKYLKPGEMMEVLVGQMV